MSLKQIFPQLAALQTEQGDSMAWKVLYAGRRQPLLVPLSLPQAKRAVAVFVRNPLLRYWGLFMLTLDHWLPRARFLSIVRLQNFPGKLILGNDDLADVALFCGSPGPLQKLTIYCPARNGGPGVVAKLAMAPSANRAIMRESLWLGTLAGDPALAKFLPHLLQDGTLPCGLKYFVMQTLPFGTLSTKFGPHHFNFLRLLAKRQPAFYVWRESPAYTRLEKRLGKITPLIDERYRELLQAALDEINRQIGQDELPGCLVHSDFAPWNLRVTADQLFVFDWEYAEDCGNPLQDFLHFHLMPRAVKRKPLRSSDMPGLLAETRTYADAMFGADIGMAAASGALTLQYLVDTVTFYVQASGYLATEHPVMRVYLNLLEQRAQWLPAPASVESTDTYDQPQYGAS
jgi:hypothetical protein